LGFLHENALAGYDSNNNLNNDYVINYPLSLNFLHIQSILEYDPLRNLNLPPYIPGHNPHAPECEYSKSANNDCTNNTDEERTLLRTIT